MAKPASIHAVYSAKELALFAGDEGPLARLNPQARLAVFGDPVAHSASPPMHNAALRECGKDLQFVRIHVPPEELQESLRNLALADFLGASLTMPHKQAALSDLDQISKEAELMGAINTVQVKDGKLLGHNTDGPGFAAAVLEQFGQELSSLRVLILGGGGGAGRAIAVQCALAECPTIFVANRTIEKTERLAAEISLDLGIQLTPIALTGEALSNAVACVDLVVNTTPLGMKAGDPSPLPDGLLTKNHFVYDAIYSGGETALLKQAENAGSRAANGFSMLLHQGALQFELWFGEPAPLETMRAALQETAKSPK